MRFDRPLQGKDVVTPDRLSLRKDGRSPLKSVSGSLLGTLRTKMILNFSRSGTGQEKCSAKAGRISVGSPETTRVLSRGVCGTARRNVPRDRIVRGGFVREKISNVQCRRAFCRRSCNPGWSTTRNMKRECSSSHDRRGLILPTSYRCDRLPSSLGSRKGFLEEFC